MILAQDGWGPTNKIKRGLREGVVEGVIFCPKTNSKSKSKDRINNFLESFEDEFFLFDPHFYATVISTDRSGKLESHSYYQNLNPADFTASEIQARVGETLEFQRRCGLNRVVSPGLIINNFNDRYSQINSQLFAESVDKTEGGENLFVCLPISEEALKDEEKMDSFLSEVTRLNTDGFYLFVERSSYSSLQWSNPRTLSNLMYLVYVLSSQGYSVVVGYIDVVGLLLLSTGANFIANGWYRTQRQYTRRRYEERGVGRPPRLEYTSPHLLNSIYVEDELKPISELGFLDEVVANNKISQKLKEGSLPEEWTREDFMLNHWSVLHNMSQKVADKKNVDNKLDWMKGRISSAQSLYSKLKKEGINFDTKTNERHLQVWKEAIALFQSKER
ncbi:MAG: hypothetical protein ABEI53_02970 [Candidatus Magasanikbacteria bacterium]